MAGHFYIVCPDNEVSSEIDNLRIMWGAADIVEGRPALSRWHPDYKVRFFGFWLLVPGSRSESRDHNFLFTGVVGEFDRNGMLMMFM